MLVKKIIEFFNKLENKIRNKLSHYPVLYAFIVGVGVVLFWRGVWHTADNVNLGGIMSIIIGAVILLLTGIFVSEFIGKKLIISGLVGEKKLIKREETEIKKEGVEIEKEGAKIKTEEAQIETEEAQLKNLQNTLNRVEKKISDLEEEIEGK